MTTGFVSLVGAGPGDPGLLTLAGRERLAAAEVVVYDRLVGLEVVKLAASGAEMVFAGKSPEGHTLTQEQINDILVAKARAGRRVVRLKGGDPFVFGRGGEEALALAAAGVPFEVVPGVTSAIAAPAYAGVPVTHRGVATSFAVVTGHEDEDKPESQVDWSRLAMAVDTLVVLMGAAALGSIAEALVAAGRSPDTPAVSVQWGTLPEQRSVAAPLSRISEAVGEAGLGAPLLTVIGDVARMRDHISWFETRPLFGKRVLVTRTRQQASVLADLLRREGASPVELPTLELVPVASEAELEGVCWRLEARDYLWTLFTSPNAVEFVGAFLERSGRDARVFAGCRVAAVGPATAAALRRLGLRADLVASESRSEGLLESLGGEDVAGYRVLLPRAEGGRETLVDGLKELGAGIDEVLLYESRPPAKPHAAALRLVREGAIDIATFASSSSVRNLASMLGPDFERLKSAMVACIGPITAATAREHGLRVDVEPKEQSVEALVSGLREHFAEKRA